LVAVIARTLQVEGFMEVEVSALLVHIGSVTLPPGTPPRSSTPASGSHRASRTWWTGTRPDPADPGEHPRLEGVLEILDDYQRAYDEKRAGRSLPLGALELCGSRSIITRATRNPATPASRSQRCAVVGRSTNPDLPKVCEDIIGSDTEE
jgi:hypothetical protein